MRTKPSFQPTTEIRNFSPGLNPRPLLCMTSSTGLTRFKSLQNLFQTFILKKSSKILSSISNCVCKLLNGEGCAFALLQWIIRLVFSVPIFWSFFGWFSIFTFSAVSQVGFLCKFESKFKPEKLILFDGILNFNCHCFLKIVKDQNLLHYIYQA